MRAFGMTVWILAGLMAAGCEDPFIAAGDAGASSDGATVERCHSAQQCPGEQLCDPATGQCVSKVQCAQHEDCADAAYCAAGKCARSAVGSPCKEDRNCLAGDACVGGFCGCRGERYQADRPSPNVMIVLDRSGSMDAAIAGGTKWAVAKQSIAKLLATHGEWIRFGLALYPGTNDDCSEGFHCESGVVFVAPGSSTATEINSILARADTCFLGTPTAAMLTELLGYQGLADPPRPNAVLLITDGQSTCGNPFTATAALRNQDPEVRTFVVGFGDEVSVGELNQIAQEGGTAIANGPPFYYVAGDAKSLANAFSSIAGQVLSCSYTLSKEPEDLGQLYVYQDKEQVIRDTAHADGWDYDVSQKQLAFYGPSCEALRSGQVSDLVIVYGCPMVIK